MSKAKTATAARDAGKRSRMPKAGVSYPKGQDKANLADSIRKAFSKVKVRQVA